MGFQPEIPIPKNVKITEEYIDAHFEEIKEIMGIFLNYPDILLDTITPYYSNFQLFFYQRIFLRACARYRYVYCVAPRAFSKSFVSIFSGILKCIFLPGQKFFIVAPGKAQGSSIAQEKINEIFQKFPFLENEIIKYNKGKDYTTLIFKNGSVFDVVANLDSQRGNRRNGGIIDEVRDQDGDMLNEVVLPLMNVSRRDMQGEIDPTEPSQQQIYISSAGNKGSYAYDKLIELSIQQIIAPWTTFCFGCDYRVPMQHGLLSKQFIEELKISQTFNEDSFARRYLREAA